MLLHQMVDAAALPPSRKRRPHAATGRRSTLRAARPARQRPGADPGRAPACSARDRVGVLLEKAWTCRWPSTGCSRRAGSLVPIDPKSPPGAGGPDPARHRGDSPRVGSRRSASWSAGALAACPDVAHVDRARLRTTPMSAPCVPWATVARREASDRAAGEWTGDRARPRLHPPHVRARRACRS
ncbi:MAG: hypothetical protein MZW92_28030 [Comamonadaceae bacterium]|nr:hypothetical protein [Comamonadaceae bacterium]